MVEPTELLGNLIHLLRENLSIVVACGVFLSFCLLVMGVRRQRRSLVERPTVMRPEYRLTFRMTEEIQGLLEREPSLDALLSERSRSQAAALVSTLARVMSRETTGRVLRLLPASLLLSSFVYGALIVVLEPPSPLPYIIMTLVFLVLQVVAVGQFFLQQSLQRLPSVVLTYSLTIVLPGLIALLYAQPPLLLALLPLVLLSFLALLPLRLTHVLILSLLTAAVYINVYGSVGVVLAMCVVLLGVGVGILSEICRREVLFSGMALSVPRVLALYESTSLLLVLRWCAQQLVHHNRSELILDDGRRVPDPLSAGLEGRTAFSEASAKLPRLSEWLTQLDREGGVLNLNEAPEAVRREWEICLGQRARGLRMCFATLEVVLRGERRKMFLVTRMPFFSRIFGRELLFRMFFSIAKLVDARQRITQLHFRSSDLVGALQVTLGRRERDLREIVHYANNMAHEAFLVEERATESDAPGDHRQLLRQLAQASATLSSDLKVLWEFSHRPSAFPLEWVEAKIMHEELVDFVDLQRQRGTQRIDLLWDLEASDWLELPGADVLFAMIRQVFRGFFFQPGSERPIVLRTERLSNDKVRFSLMGAPHPGIEALAAGRNRFPTSGGPEDIPSHREELMQGLRSLCERLGSSLEMRDGIISFDLRIGEAPTQRVVERVAQSMGGSTDARWMLFLDDSPNARKLYDQIGRQLKIEYSLAASAVDARKLIDVLGPPSFIVSDEELGAESGSKFLRDLEAEMGLTLYGYLVTGQEPSPGLRARLPDSMEILSKPIGRKKLLERLEAAIREFNLTVLEEEK